VKAIIACGSRRWTDEALIVSNLEALCAANRDQLVVIEGCATGADHIAETWASQKAITTPGVYPVHFPAQWKLEGRAAGPLRNQRMLDHLTTLRDRDGAEIEVVAFTDTLEGSGTGDMVRRAERAGVATRVVSNF
jgi:hypothetical protein